MAKFIKLEDGTFVNAASIHRIHVEQRTESDVWTLKAQITAQEGHGYWADLAGEFDSQKDAENAIRKIGK
ncbi:hypothetical protein GCM10008955_31670 [Deinococcus malanensis]|uniref:SPOR domain-containing protein n=1 Tax=Deinococcus malanensis TaxID=1706855 RepID=A0ABQ2EZC6_9DEIO|nr:hypothetical protein [Deinococcus malanensis]GGK35422.1 hypothetical protein GCM10008955_31670 [Deinococcus malanensis]